MRGGALWLALSCLSLSVLPAAASWENTFGSGMRGGDITALATYHHDLIAGGAFTQAGEVPASCIAGWNGMSWTSMGEGLAYQGGGGTSPSVNALMEFGGNLIVGGRFTRAGAVPAADIAAWDGTSWSSLSTGVGPNGIVWALCVYHGQLIAGGGFQEAGGVVVNGIAAWNGTSWSPLGSGMDGGVFALAVYHGSLIAGGSFRHAGGIPCSRIASWDGTAWRSVGPGFDAGVFALLVRGEDLIVGGNFAVGPLSAIARWDGVNWYPIATGIVGIVASLANYNGDLVAAGYFVDVGDFFPRTSPAGMAVSGTRWGQA